MQFTARVETDGLCFWFELRSNPIQPPRYRAQQKQLLCNFSLLFFLCFELEKLDGNKKKIKKETLFVPTSFACITRCTT